MLLAHGTFTFFDFSICFHMGKKRTARAKRNAESVARGRVTLLPQFILSEDMGKLQRGSHQVLPRLWEKF